MVDKTELREHWRAAAPGWLMHGDFVRETTEPVSRAMIERAAPVPGECWLDVAGGVGDPALYVALALDGGGQAVVTDLVVEMAAKSRAVVREAAPALRVSAVAASADEMPFEGAFDGLTCRFGVMFFPEPLPALVALRQTLKPGGRGVFAVWAERERNAFFREVSAAVLARFPEMPVPDPDEPHTFRFSTKGELAEFLRMAGWTHVGEADLPFVMSSRRTVDQFWDHLTGLSVELRGLVSEMPAEEARSFRRDIEDRVAPFFESGSMRLPAHARLVWGRAPGGIRGVA
ncbi:MAG: class I SAM-dependent methyltransferase [Gemmatimonadota bacterium]